MAFIVFDVEIVLFYPYAVARGGLGVFGLVAVLVFSFVVFESFVYLIGAGVHLTGDRPRSPCRRYHGPSVPRCSTAALAEAPVGEDGDDGDGDASQDGVRASAPTRSTVRRVGLEGRWDGSAGRCAGGAVVGGSSGAGGVPVVVAVRCRCMPRGDM